MSRLTLPLAALALTGAVASLLYLTFGGQSFGNSILFPMQLIVIAACANALFKVRKQGITNFFAVPKPAMLILLVLAIIGGGLAFQNMRHAMPKVSPAGQSVHSYNAEVQEGECRATFNATEKVVLPMTACESLSRSISLAFANAWLLFGSLAMWLALVVSAHQDGSGQRA